MIKKERDVVRENKGRRNVSDEPFWVELACLVPFEFCNSLNIVAFLNEGFPSFCWCLFNVCIVLEGQNETRASL